MGKKADLESVHLVNHSKCMMAAFQNFRMDETMLDVTLVCNGQRMKAHKLVLSACSPFFKEIFAENPCTHPIIILRDFEFADLKAVIDFIYKGELSVPRERLISALKVAEELHIRGLKRNEPSGKKYEKLYNKVVGKTPSRKKRKRHHQDSSDSDVKECVHVSESDENVIDSDGSAGEKNDSHLLESQSMDVENVDEHSFNDQDSRPFVLRVGDPAVSNDETNSKNLSADDESAVVDITEPEISDDLMKENLADEDVVEDENYDSVPEDVASTSQLDSFVDCSENSNSLQDSVPTENQSGNQADQSTASFDTATPEEEADVNSSSLCLSPESLDREESHEADVHDGGKRFVCSKCNCVFTSRINFMRHKMLGHNKTDKRSPYKCQQCTFSAEDLESLTYHVLNHCDQVPYTSTASSQDFVSEELCEKPSSDHEQEEISLDIPSEEPHEEPSPDHEQEEISLHIPSESVEGLLPIPGRVQEKITLFRCSVCFTKFTSRLSCQLHEKTCQGGS